MKFHLFLISCFTLLSSCQLDCGVVENRVRYTYRLTAADLAYFPYSQSDTINYFIKGRTYINCYPVSFKDTITEVIISSSNPDCGENEVDKFEIRNVVFNNSSSEGRLNLKINAGYFGNTELKCYFEKPFYRNFSIILNKSSKIDTLTLDGKLFSDVYLNIDTSENTYIYYSKSKGLLKIDIDNYTFFKLL